MNAILERMGNKFEKKELSQPKEKWFDIKKQTIDEYCNGFIEYVKSKNK